MPDTRCQIKKSPTQLIFVCISLRALTPYFRRRADAEGGSRSGFWHLVSGILFLSSPHHPREERLQITRLRNGRVDRMIRALMPLLDDLDVSAGVLGSPEHRSEQ